MNYQMAFHAHAKKMLAPDQYEAVHNKARATAGGHAKAEAMRQADAESRAHDDEELDDDGEPIEKFGPTSSDVHVPVPLGAKDAKEKDPKKGKKKPPFAKADDDKAKLDAVAAVVKAALTRVRAATRRTVEVDSVGAADPIDAIIKAAVDPKPVGERYMTVMKKRGMPIIDATKKEQTVYCVALEPHTTDFHGDVMLPEDIAKTAGRFLTDSRVIGSMHKGPIAAEPVESFIAPADIKFTAGMYGDQVVKKGSWVLGIKIHDPKEWAKVVSGEYSGISVGGYGLRSPVTHT